MKNLEWTTEMPTVENVGQRFLLEADNPVSEQVVTIKFSSCSSNPSLYVDYDYWNWDEWTSREIDLSELKNALWFGPIPEPKEVA